MSFEMHGHFFNFSSPQELIPPEESMPNEQSTQSTPSVPPTTTTTTTTIPSPPTDQTFETPEQAENLVREFAKSHGFSVAKHRSKKDSESQSISAIYLGCDCGRVCELQENRDAAKRRRTGSMRVDCPFSVVVRYSKERMKYFLDNRNTAHNHEPATRHPARRRRTRKDRDEVKESEKYLGTPIQHLNPISRRLNVGVMGAGSVGQRHALNILHLVPRANLVCLFSTTRNELDWANTFCRPHGVHVCWSFEEMIATPGLEAVIITSATVGNTKCISDLLDKGIHVLCERPTTLDLDEFSTLIAKSESRPETKVMAASARCFDADYTNARAKVAAGDIGVPIVFYAKGCEMLDKSERPVKNSKSSGGIFVDIGAHSIDLALSFFGDGVRPRALWATGTTALHKGPEKCRDSDNAVGVVEFWTGKVAYCYLSRSTAHGYDDATEIFGTKGKMTVDTARRSCIEVSDIRGLHGEPTRNWTERYSGAFLTQIREFTAAALDNTEPPLKFSSSFASLRIALALQESLVTRQKIEFDEQGKRITPSTTMK